MSEVLDLPDTISDAQMADFEMEFKSTFSLTC